MGRTGTSQSLAEAARRTLRQWRTPADLEEARSLQWALARQVRAEDGPTRWRWVLGLDSAFVEGGRRIVAGAVLWDAAQRTKNSPTCRASCPSGRHRVTCG
ncbi:MAG: hypothetical protein NZ742_03950 [Acidobacteria bacterium]|nr:hypothetical protein [Acidobacteriota bacterium]MDW7984062.1 hypothetical protein [Acidobacteriota bacterium]